MVYKADTRDSDAHRRLNNHENGDFQPSGGVFGWKERGKRVDKYVFSEIKTVLRLS